MKCPECELLGLTSTLSCRGTLATADNINRRFTDENGNAHDHHPWHREVWYVCSNGHPLRARKHPECDCGWKYAKDQIELDPSLTFLVKA